MRDPNFSIQHLQFDDRGLMPTIVQNSRTQQILQFLYLNAEALTCTLQTGIVHNVAPSDPSVTSPAPLLQPVTDIWFDQAGKALMILIDPHNAPVSSTFSNHFYETDYEKTYNSLAVVHPSSLELGILLDELSRLIEDRKQTRPEGSYTTFLFNAGLDKILKQIGLETAEMIIAAKNGVTPQITIEIADLIYHLLVLMSQSGVRLIDIFNELKQRATLTAEQKSPH
jgi:phosphoribosyl-ATP pyrophosphohydrolase/phosphoribosyl-AMP cyclohydrolase